MLRQAATKLVLGMFIVSLAWTLFFFGFSMYAYSDPDYGNQDYYTDEGTHVVVTGDTDAPALFMFACSPAFAIFTLMLFAFWRHRKAWDKLADDLPSYVRMYRRATPERLAARMGITVKQLDQVMKICIREGTVRGAVDPATGEFVSADAGDFIRATSASCPNCGAPVEERFLRGEAVRCMHCGALLGSGRGPGA